jgi:hypothetical protein
MQNIEHPYESEQKKKSASVFLRRSLVDRRSGEDSRKFYSLDYFIEGGQERRKGKERRQSGERRNGWVRVYKWCSVFLGKKTN